MKALLLASVAALVVGGAARASIIPELSSVTPSGSDFLFSYQGQLAPDQGVKFGNELVIIDFNGYVPGSVSSSGNPDVLASVSNLLPAGLILEPGATDSSSIPDLVFTYVGPPFQTTGGPFGGDTNFNGLTALSIYGNMQLGTFSAVAVNNSGADTGTATFNVGSIEVPSAVPEPASWLIMLLGVGMVGAGLRMSRRANELGLGAL